ncbi:hypothetical protein U91I_03317 [alpha proteobacterium U9-1i]|nr:hypothetical protein U91I_03317 [alpha proteobacterium U9-1i]
MSEELPPIVEEIVIARDIERVWEVMTADERAPLWLGCMRYTRELGHVFYMQQDQAKAKADDVSGATQCEILALEEPSLFKFSWFLPGFPATYVSFRLEAMAGGSTRVVFQHEGWDKFPADQIKPIRDMLSGGWKSYVLPGLKKAAES